MLIAGLIIGLIIGTLIGTVFGIMVFVFCNVVKMNDEYAKKYQAEWEREQNENNG